VADLLWWGVAPPIVIGLALSFALERLLQPSTVPFYQRPAAAVLIHVALWLLLFAIELALFRRPWFAAANVLALLLFIVLVSNAKFHALREPFIFQDFEYFTDALKHPRLYLPFLGLGKAVIAALGFGAALFAGLSLESSLLGRMAGVEFIMTLFLVLLVAALLLWLGASKKLGLSLEPATDLRQLGLMASLWRYGEQDYAQHRVYSAYENLQPAGVAAQALPNLVVVQSESFFDARELSAAIRPQVLHEFDAIKATAACHGKLRVPAWGANTVRTEFAFLSGLAADALGVHRFNPYRKLAREGLASLASFLKSLGYRTVCVHPYPSSFYARDTVLPSLGFDEFIDIRSFDGAAKTGPYVGDVVLAEKVCALLAASSTQPIFVFVITMENHGPLHLEKVQEGDVERFYSSSALAGCDDLTIYLRHLCNADRMAAMLRDQLHALPRPACLCWFGDHVPIMPEVYATLGVPDGRTDYLIWTKGIEPSPAGRVDMRVEDLAALLLEKTRLVVKVRIPVQPDH